MQTLPVQDASPRTDVPSNSGSGSAMGRLKPDEKVGDRIGSQGGAGEISPHHNPEGNKI